jgi:hypothetical protein
MIIPIRPPSNSTLQQKCGGSITDVEWVMIELNGELLKPLEDSTSDEDGGGKRRMELGSVKFDSSVRLQYTVLISISIG